MLADLVLILHVGFVLFVVGAAILTALGGVLRWQWVRRRSFRYAHVGAILFVVAEALLGIACPLTVLEDRLRGSTETRSFIGRWLGELLYYDLPEWVFTIVYVFFAAFVLALWRWVPPNKRGRG